MDAVPAQQEVHCKWQSEKDASINEVDANLEKYFKIWLKCKKIWAPVRTMIKVKDTSTTIVRGEYHQLRADEIDNKLPAPSAAQCTGFMGVMLASERVSLAWQHSYYLLARQFRTHWKQVLVAC